MTDFATRYGKWEKELEHLIELIVVGVSSFLLTAILSHFLIPILRGKHIGQSIRPEGPKEHRKKSGTPTMGGIGFIMAILFVLAVVSVIYFIRGKQKELIPLAMTLMLALMNGLIGFVDDYCKLLKKQNEGLKAHQKFLLQVLAAAIYIAVLRITGVITTELHIPFTDRFVDLGIVYYVFALLMIVGIVNSVNLTDGIDGLAGSVTLVVAGFFALVAFRLENTSLRLLSACLIGGMIGFLIYNLNPAKFFMGDTGSLFLGGAVSGAAFLMNEPMLIFICGGVYVLETISVMLQVGCFKLCSKRIFKMAPIHHHFQACKWSENRIVCVFSGVTLLLCILAWFGIAA